VRLKQNQSTKSTNQPIINQLQINQSILQSIIQSTNSINNQAIFSLIKHRPNQRADQQSLSTQSITFIDHQAVAPLSSA